MPDPAPRDVADPTILDDSGTVQALPDDDDDDDDDADEVDANALPDDNGTASVPDSTPSTPAAVPTPPAAPIDLGQPAPVGGTTT